MRAVVMALGLFLAMGQMAWGQKIDVRREVLNFEAFKANTCQHARHEYGMRYIAQNFPDVSNSRNLRLKADKLRAHCNAAERISANDYAGMEKWLRRLDSLSVTPANEAARRVYRHSRAYEIRARQYFICDERGRNSFSALLGVVIQYSLPKYHSKVEKAFDKWVAMRNSVCPITNASLSKARKELRIREKFFSTAKRATRKST